MELSLLNLLLESLGLLAALGHAVDGNGLLDHLTGLVAFNALGDLDQSEAGQLGVVGVLEGALLELHSLLTLLTLALLELALSLVALALLTLTLLTLSLVALALLSPTFLRFLGGRLASLRGGGGFAGFGRALVLEFLRGGRRGRGLLLLLAGLVGLLKLLVLLLLAVLLGKLLLPLLVLLLTVLLLLLATLLLLLSPLLTMTLALGAVAGLGFSLLLFLLDLLLQLGVDLALAGLVQGSEGVGSNKEGAGAQWNITGATHLSDLNYKNNYYYKLSHNKLPGRIKAQNQ